MVKGKQTEQPPAWNIWWPDVLEHSVTVLFLLFVSQSNEHSFEEFNFYFNKEIVLSRPKQKKKAAKAIIKAQIALI